MTVEDAIRTAIDLEIKVRDVYLKAMDGTSDQAGKRIFRVLADEENSHHDYLQSKLDEWKKSGKITMERLNSAIPSKDITKKLVSRIEKRISEEDKGSELKILSKAYNLESETKDFYKKMEKELPEEGKDIFSRFVEIEEGHLAIVQAEIDYLTKTGYWLDIKEFDME